MNIIKKTFLRLDTQYLIKNYLIGLFLGIFFWKANMDNGAVSTKIYIIIAIMLFPFSKLVFNDLRAAIFKGNIILMPILIVIFLKLVTNIILFLGTWIFTPLGLLYLYILNIKEKKQSIENFKDLFLSGVKKFNCGNYKDALVVFNEILEADNTCVAAYNYRAGIKIEFEDYEGAISDSNFSLSYEEKNPTALNNRGLAYFYLNNLEKAKNDFDNALNILENMPSNDETTSLKKIILSNIELLKEN